MDMLKKLSLPAQAVLGAAVLYLIFSFLDWQQVSAFGLSYGRTEWSGIGILAGLLVIVLLLWEGARLFDIKIALGSVSPGLVSLGLALALLLFTVITFLTHSTARHWPAWIGLLLSIVIAVAAFMRGKDEGVEMSEFGSLASKVSSSVHSAASSATSSSSSSTSEPPAASPPPTPPPSGDDEPAA